MTAPAAPPIPADSPLIAALRAKLPELDGPAREALYRNLLAESARGEGVEAVADFGECVFGHVAAEKHRDWIVADLDHSRVALTSPPESAKTTWMTVILTAWRIGKHPERSYGIGTAGDNAADDMTKAVADTIEHNPMWKLVFPHVVPDKQRGWSSEGYHVRRDDLPSGEWERLRYGDKNPTLVGGGVGSARWNGLRITGRLVLDDMHDRRSKTQQKTNDDTVGFFKDTAEFRVTGQGHLTIVQTRWNPKDIIALVKTRPDFKVFEHPAIVDAGTENERSYWPAQHSLEKLRAIRDRSPIDFELVFQGDDTAVEGTVLKREWLAPFTLKLEDRWPRYFGIDPAKRVKQILKKGDDPDSFRIAVLVSTGVSLVVEDVYGGVMFAPDAEDLYFTLASKIKPRLTGIETNGLGGEYYQAFLRRMNVLGSPHVLIPVKTSVDIGERMAQVAPYFSSGQILVADSATPGLEAFRAEWVMFPRGHDDTLSAMHIAWKIATHHLPHENPERARERAERMRHTRPPARRLEEAYYHG